MANYFYDEHRTRYDLVNTRSGAAYNWLFFPGGPGADSSYLSSLTDLLDLPGNVWLIDLPGNGSNFISEEYDFDQWMNLYPRFQNLKIQYAWGIRLEVCYLCCTLN